MALAVFPPGAKALHLKGGVADDADSTRMIPGIPDGSSTWTGLISDCILFLGCGCRPSSGYPRFRHKDNTGGVADLPTMVNVTGSATPVELERSSTNSPFRRRPVPVTLVLNLDKCLTASMAALFSVTRP